MAKKLGLDGTNLTCEAKRLQEELLRDMSNNDINFGDYLV